MPSESDTPLILTAVLGLFGGGGIVGLFGLLANRRKNSAETVLLKANADNVVIGSALDYVKAIREEAIDLRKRAADQEMRAEKLEQKINILEDHIRLQTEIIGALRRALAEYNPNHPLLLQADPPSPVK